MQCEQNLTWTSKLHTVILPVDVFILAAFHMISIFSYHTTCHCCSLAKILILIASCTISLFLSIFSLYPPLSAYVFCSVVERDGVNMTVCVFPLNSGTESDKKIVTAVGTVILFGCVLYSW